MARNTGGNRGDVRQSALWGSGNRGGEFRSNALWGKGGRGLVTTVVAFALAVPLAAGASGGSGKNPVASGGGSHVSQQLKDKAKQNPNELVSVIITSDAGSAGAQRAAKAIAKLGRKLELIGGVVAELRAKDVETLERIPGLVVTLDAPVKKSSLIGSTSTTSTSTQLWTHETGVNKLWGGPQAPAIAVVDSGIDTSHPSFVGNRVVARQVFGSSSGGSLDGRGHGTFVASIAAGNAAGYAGSAPNAPLIDLDVMDDNGVGRTSDVIAAAEWIHQNKAAYNIRVANFSLHSGAVNHFWLDPLNVAVEKLWFSGVVVVAAAGNYGNADGTPSGVRHAPGSDPFVITVGSVDIGGTAGIGNDSRPAFSAYGRTPDGFWKPEICAPGRYMVGAIPMGSTLAALKADKIKATGWIELSGTSFAAPVISGLAAQILARTPGLTPDQVKGNVMRRSRPVPKGEPMSCGVGQINGTRSALFDGAANPNAALSGFVKPGVDGTPVFDAVSWTDVSWSDVSWDSVSWTDVSWSDVSWDSVSWSDVSWTDVSWSDVSWSDVSWEDNAEGEPTLPTDGYELTETEAADAATDPDLLTPEEAAALLSATATLVP